MQINSIDELVRQGVAATHEYMQKNSILKKPLCPPRLSIDELGWEAFLQRFDKDTFEYLKTDILNFGLEKAGRLDSHIQKNKADKDRHEQWIQSIETWANRPMPRELFYGGVPYPPKTLHEEQIAEEKFHEMQAALSALHTVRPDIYDDPRYQVFIRGTHLFPPASEQAIRDVEKHFAVQLPPSYKAFLKVSNGCFLGLRTWLPIEQIGLTSELHDVLNKQAIIAEYLEYDTDIPDDIYYDYDDLGIVKEEFPFPRIKKFFNGLLITNPNEYRGDYQTDIYPYYPKSPYTDGEWEISCINGIRARNFKCMMEYLYLETMVYFNIKG